jgi:hypothetical protein
MNGPELLRHVTELAIEIGTLLPNESPRSWARRAIPVFTKRYKGPKDTLPTAIGILGTMSRLMADVATEETPTRSVGGQR